MDKLNTILTWLETKLNTGFYFRRGLSIAVFVLTWKLTEWGMHFANAALAAKADLLGVAAILGAVAGIPVAILAMVFKQYQESRDNNVVNRVD